VLYSFKPVGTVSVLKQQYILHPQALESKKKKKANGAEREREREGDHKRKGQDECEAEKGSANSLKGF
jgi:hypothetical protein